MSRSCASCCGVFEKLQTITYILKDNDYYNQQPNIRIKQQIKKTNKTKITQTILRKIGHYLHIPTKKPKQSKLLKQSNINIAFKTTNTIRNILNTQPEPNIYHNSGIYQSQCQTCFRKYIGQTGRTFHARYTEHIQDIQNNRCNTGFHNISQILDIVMVA
jgi:hypothetical protein